MHGSSSMPVDHQAYPHHLKACTAWVLKGYQGVGKSADVVLGCGVQLSLYAGGLIQEVSSRAHDLGSSAMSVPAGIFGTISANANAAPRLLLGDIVAVYHTAADAFADLSARGEPGWLQ